MSSDYTLYYWSIPFRGHFIRHILAQDRHASCPSLRSQKRIRECCIVLLVAGGLHDDIAGKAEVVAQGKPADVARSTAPTPVATLPAFIEARFGNDVSESCIAICSSANCRV